MLTTVDEKQFKLWQEGKISLSVELRDEITVKFLPVVRSVACRIAHRLPSHVEVNDLVSAGTVGLLDALDKFDSKYKASFRTYAENRINGSILDELRKVDWAPRSVRQSTKKLQSTVSELSKRLSRPPSEEEIAEEMSIGVEDVRKILKDASSTTLFSLDEPRGDEGKSLKEGISAKETPDYSPYEHLKARETKQLIKETIDTLPEKEKLVLSLYYFEELTMKEIGLALDITESRVCQLHGKAIITMRAKLSSHRL